MDPRVETTQDVILASSIIISPCMRPSRIVLRELQGEYVIHLEVLNLIPPKEGESCRLAHSHFEHGNYFRFTNDLDRHSKRKQAEACFLQRSRTLFG